MLHANMKGGEKTFHHCRNFPYNFPTLPRVLTLQMCAKGQGRRERAPITCLSQDDSSGCGKALHPSIRPLAFTFPHPISACHLPQRGEKSHSWPRQLQNGAAQRRGIHSLSPLPQEALSWVAGRRTVSLSRPPPSPRPVPEMDGTMRRVLCTCAPVWCSTFDDSSSTPYLSPIASPSSNAISSKRLTKYICNQLVTRTK